MWGSTGDVFSMLKDKHATVNVVALGGGDRELVIPLPGVKGDAEAA